MDIGTVGDFLADNSKLVGGAVVCLQFGIIAAYLGRRTIKEWRKAPDHSPKQPKRRRLYNPDGVPPP